MGSRAEIFEECLAAAATCACQRLEFADAVRMFRVCCACFFICAAFLSGCRPPDKGAAVERSSSPPLTNQQVYQVTGLVLGVDATNKTVRIKHDPIPGYMDAMTMPFEVRDERELEGVEPGDPVRFRMLVAESEAWIDQIEKTGPKRNDPPTTGRFRLVREVEPLAVGDLLPEYHFTNQLGQAFSTTNFLGQALAINFLFTRCPYPTFCPQTARYFAETQNALAALPEAPTNWQLLTISFDPEFDTPAVLKRYAENYQYDPAHWTFATGKLIDITAIAEQFGLMFSRESEAGFSHNLRTIVIDPAGRVQTIIGGNTWKPDDLISEIRKATQVTR